MKWYFGWCVLLHFAIANLSIHTHTHTAQHSDWVVFRSLCCVARDHTDTHNKEPTAHSLPLRMQANNSIYTERERESMSLYMCASALLFSMIISEASTALTYYTHTHEMCIIVPASSWKKRGTNAGTGVWLLCSSAWMTNDPDSMACAVLCQWLPN